jgi:hypothetical protein
MKIKCKSNKFNEFNRYGSDEKIQLTIGNRYDVISSILKVVIHSMKFYVMMV